MTRTSRVSPNGSPEERPLNGRASVPRTGPVTCIVLVGLPGAGKSTIGPLVADRLGWRFVDLDEEIERAAGRSVAEIFAADGEVAFRQLEHEETRRVASIGLVFAPGGGWMLDPANLRALGTGARTVYLRVSPETAISRMASSAAARPLLATSDPLSALKGLLAARERAYLQANHTVEAESMPPNALADSIVALVTGWRAH